MKTYKHSNLPPGDSGFTLVELIGVMSVVAILAGLAVLPMLGWIDQARFKAERETLATLANEVRMSFRQEDMSKNISALEGDMPVGSVNITEFDYWAALENAEFALENAWYGRLASLRGQKPDGSLLKNQQGDLKEIAYNSYHRRRLMLVGPVENDQQRYIILSFMFPPGGPVIPAILSDRVTYDDANHNPVPNDAGAYAQWFNAIYNFNWGDTADSLPNGAGWNVLAPGDDPSPQAASPPWWTKRSSNGRSFLQRVVAQRIVQPRFRVTLNNNSPKTTTVDTTTNPHTTKIMYPDRVYIYTNMLKWTDYSSANLHTHVDGSDTPSGSNSVQLFPNSVNDTRTVGILEGRRVVVRRERGPVTDGVPVYNEGNAEPVLSVLINENMTYTAQ